VRRHRYNRRWRESRLRAFLNRNRRSTKSAEDS
jgi:hypothetical protein